MKSKIRAAFLIEPEVGVLINDAIEEALKLRKSFRGPVLLNHNTVVVEVTRDSTRESVYADWIKRYENKGSW
jgi:hypothetical protein